MSAPWDDGAPPPVLSVTPAGWLRVVLRGGAIALLILIGLVTTLPLRLIERPLFGLRRPVTPWIAMVMWRGILAVLGLRVRVRGAQMRDNGAVVANHASWLDIVVLNARKRVFFVAKAEVASWPGISTLAKIAGTLFIQRDPRAAGAQVAVMRARLELGHKLLFFPEGTSTDGRRVLPFKTTLFAAFFAEALREIMHVQPVTVIYHAPKGADPRLYGWWGDMDLGPHLVAMLALPRHGSVELIYHPPVRVADFADRKALARACETAVRAPLVEVVDGSRG